MLSVTSVSIPAFLNQLLSLEHKRTHSPTLAWYSFSFANPESITYLTPGIVTDVSATFVERMILRVLGGVMAKAFACSLGERRA